MGTPEVAEAKATFKAAFDAAEAGEHAALRPDALHPVNNDVQAPQIASAYLDDVEEVVAAKAAFQAAFDDAAAGGLVAKQAPAPVHVIPEPAPLTAAPVPVVAPAAPVMAAAPVEAAAPVVAAAPILATHPYAAGFPIHGLGYAGLGYHGLAYNTVAYTGVPYGVSLGLPYPQLTVAAPAAPVTEE